MKFSAAALLTTLAATAVSAFPANGTTPAVVTETVAVYVTYCPAATTIVDGPHTYVATAPGPLTMTNGPYTVTRPVYTTSSVVCQGGCTTPAPAPVHHSNSTASLVPYKPITPTALPPATTAAETPIPTGGAAKMAGAGLAAVLGFAVFAL